MIKYSALIALFTVIICLISVGIFILISLTVITLNFPSSYCNLAELPCNDWDSLIKYSLNKNG